MAEAIRYDRANFYFAAALAGGRSLAQQLTQLDLSQGTLASIPTDALHAGFSPDRGGLGSSSVLFEHGNFRFVRVDRSHVKRELIRLLADHLRSFQDAFVLMEHSLARAGDFWLARSRLGYVTHNDTVILYVKDAATIEEALNAIPFRSFVAALTHSASVIRSGSNVQTTDLKAWTDGCTQIIVGAFDGEGALVWSRHAAELTSH